MVPYLDEIVFFQVSFKYAFLFPIFLKVLLGVLLFDIYLKLIIIVYCLIDFLVLGYDQLLTSQIVKIFVVVTVEFSS